MLGIVSVMLPEKPVTLPSLALNMTGMFSSLPSVWMSFTVSLTATPVVLMRTPAVPVSVRMLLKPTTLALAEASRA